MSQQNTQRFGPWLTVVVFATAMAWVESAVVYYLRTMVDRIDPYQPYPLPVIRGLGTAEMVREAATMVMLLMVGILAGRSWRSRFGYTALAFGVWDLFYYLFLKAICDWPHSLFDWDVLFLLPVPWWGPVLAPISIAALMIIWGTLVTQNDQDVPALGVNWKLWALNLVGVALALYTFMEDALRAAGHGLEALHTVLPQQFHWTLFGLAWLLMAAPVLRLSRLHWRQSLQRSRDLAGDGRRAACARVTD